VLALTACAVVAAGSDLATGAPPRRHRPHLPPVCSPCQLTVDETEWRVRLSRVTVAPGGVTFRIYNRGMDDHDFVVRNRADRSVVHRIELIKTLENDRVTLRLQRGTYDILCDYFEGTSYAHEPLGMKATLVVA
jgi:hypothetical protein